MPIVITSNVLPTAVQSPAAANIVLQAGSVVSARVLQILAPDQVRIAIAGQPIDVLTKVPLQAGETYRVISVMEYACPCGRSDALLDVGVDFAWCQTRFRLLPKPKAEAKTRRVSAPKEKETAR